MAQDIRCTIHDSDIPCAKCLASNTTDSKQDNAPRKLTLPELNHLVGLLESQRELGSYAGPRQQYYDRTERLITWCNDQIKQMKRTITPDHLRRRRAAMPDYDKKLKEWLS